MPIRTYRIYINTHLISHYAIFDLFVTYKILFFVSFMKPLNAKVKYT